MNIEKREEDQKKKKLKLKLISLNKFTMIISLIKTKRDKIINSNTNYDLKETFTFSLLQLSPLYKTLNLKNNNILLLLNNTIDVNIKSLDNVILIFLNEVKEKVNQHYFSFASKLLFLFRECINLHKNNPDYSKIGLIEDVPNYCNIFLESFMEPNNFYGLEQSEIIELMQYFCQWLYENKYTSSILSITIV